jgi:hypothetical protein
VDPSDSEYITIDLAFSSLVRDINWNGLGASKLTPVVGTPVRTECCEWSNYGRRWEIGIYRKVIKIKSDAAYLVCLVVIHGMAKNGDKAAGPELYTKQWRAGLLDVAKQWNCSPENMSLANQLTENTSGCNQDFRQEIVRHALSVPIHQYWIGPHLNAD